MEVGGRAAVQLAFNERGEFSGDLLGYKRLNQDGSSKTKPGFSQKDLESWYQGRSDDAETSRTS